MKSLLFVTALLCAVSAPVLAQTTTDTTTPAVATPDTKNAKAPVEGENSFTETQAKARIQDAGYTGVTGLKLDDKGVWRGTGTKGGKSMPIGLDYQGNVVTQ